MEQSTAAPTTEQVSIRHAVAGEVLALMGRHRVSQKRLAAHLGMSQPPMSKRLAGLVAFDVDELDAIASFFQVPITDLLGRGQKFSLLTPVATDDDPYPLALFDEDATPWNSRADLVGV